MADASALTQQLLAAQKNGGLGSLIGHEDAAKFGGGAIPTDMDGLVKAFGQTDIDDLMKGGAQPAAAPPPATPAPGPAPVGDGAPAPASQQLGPPVIPPPAVPGAAGAGWQSSNAPGSLAGNLGGRKAAGPFGALTDAMSRRGRMY